MTWYERNKERATATNKAWAVAHKEQLVEYRKAYYQANKERHAAVVKAWAAANPDKRKAARQKGYEVDPERVLAHSKRWREANPEKVGAARKRWNEANPLAVQRHWADRRARVEAVFVESVDRGVVFDRDGGVCQVCDSWVLGDEKWHIDHRIPISKGGEHSYANCQLAHAFCNMSKHDKVT